MGTSSSEAIVVPKRDLNAMEDLANFLSRKTSPEFQEAGARERSEQVVELSSPRELGSVEEEDDDDGFKTPTPTASSSREAESPAAVRCPPAPRKARAVRSAKRKDRGGAGVALLDLTDEIDSLFPPAIRRHLYGKIKKAKLESNATALC